MVVGNSGEIRSALASLHFGGCGGIKLKKE
jgi:hypothetical protein